MSTAVRRVCLFAQHGRGARLSEATLHYLRELARAEFRVHLALSGKDRVDPDDRSILSALGIEAHPRANGGLDFGAWQDLIRAGLVADADEILLANDSVFGPLAPLAPIIDEMAGFDAWGMVESREGRPHLQSWFILMTRAAFETASVGRVFALDFAAMSKAEIIVHGELGLGAAFEAACLDVGARYRARLRIRPSAVLPTNPMHFRWRRLIESGAVPFIKAELLRDNPSGILGLGPWRRVVGATGGMDPSVIEAALDRKATPSPAPGARPALLQLALREDRRKLLWDLWRQRRPRDGETAGLAPGRADRSTRIS